MSRTRATVLAAIGFIAFLALWEAMPRLGIVNPSLLPGPSALPAAFWQEVTSGIWLDSVESSLSHYVLGLGIGAVLGVTLGTLTGMFRTLDALTSWVVRVVRPVPGLAWVPFAILWFGVSTGAALFIIAVGVFWIVFFATQGGVRGVDRDLIEVADAFGFRSPWARLVKVILPAALPSIMVGVRTALGQAWMSVVAAEIFGVTGVGQRMMQASSLLATEIVVVYMLTMAALYGAFDTGFVALQNWLLRWKA
ncbi:MAG TPA: ABC transporter permease [Stellaceae bacterium]|jgi:NitT/TauT family transport system permease protein|nr:ABC transporter permease [Stellaceae bacterium]